MVKRCAARYVTHHYDPCDSSTDMLEKLHWPVLEQNNAEYRLSMFYKIVNSDVDICSILNSILNIDYTILYEGYNICTIASDKTVFHVR